MCKQVLVQLCGAPASHIVRAHKRFRSAGIKQHRDSRFLSCIDRQCFQHGNRCDWAVKNFGQRLHGCEADPQTSDETENIAALLKIAVAEDLVSLVYQPILNVSTNQTEGV